MKRILCSTAIFIALFMAVVSLTGCGQKKFARSFYVQDLDLTIDIERRDSLGLNDYRIYIYRSNEQKGQDYVDVKYEICEMPCITFSFPLDASNDINVIDKRYGDVQECHSTNFNFIHKGYEEINNGEINVDHLEEVEAYHAWTDSVMYEAPCINVSVDDYMISLSLWDNNKTSLGAIWQREFMNMW